MKQIIAASILALGIVSAGWLTSQSYLSVNQQRTVSVKGLSERVVKADLAVVTFRYSNTAQTLEKLYEHSKQSQQAIIAFLKNAGFDTHSIQLGLPTITDNFNSDYNTNQKSERFKATNQIILVDGNVDSVRKTLQQTDKLVSEGIVIDGVNVVYRYTSLNNIKQEMLTKGVKNAQSAAKVFAKNADARLGKIKYASQGQFSINDASGDYRNDDIMKKVRVVSSVTYYLED